MKNKFQRTLMLGGAAVVALTVFTSNARSASAAIVMRRAVAVDVDDMGVLPGSSFVGGTGSDGTNMLDRGALSTAYSNGQDQASYLAGNPKHWDGSGFEWFSAAGKTAGNVDFNLGSVYNVANVVIWNEDVFGIRDFDIWASNDGLFGAGSAIAKFTGYRAANQAVSGLNIGSFLETAQKFDLGTPTAAQFIRLVIKNTYGYEWPNRDGFTSSTAFNPNVACTPASTPVAGKIDYCAASIGHVAFGVDNIPTPALLPGLIGLGVTAWRKRRQLAE